MKLSHDPLKVKKFFRPSWVEVNLSAIRHNIRQIRALAGNRIKILPVIKDDAYGHGIAFVARTLLQEGVDFLGVSNIDEGILLRKIGVRCPILIIGYILPEYAPLMVDYQLTPTVCTLDLARTLDQAARKKKKTMAIHLKLDTGMGRLGVSRPEAVRFVAQLSRFPHLRLEGLYTHFPLADTNPLFTNEQIKEVASFVRYLDTLGLVIPYVHAANSMGILGYPSSYLNLARPGIMLYGLLPHPRYRRRIKLKSALSVKSKIVFLKEICKGQGVSYGHTFVAPRAIKVATVPVGYSDGYLRCLSNRAFALVGGRRCRVLGTITMDQMMLDVSRVPKVKIGSEVVLLGSQGKEKIDADELAGYAGTINYEITCALGSRLPKIYVK